jgi:vacuolar protein sorting-associated protein 35
MLTKLMQLSNVQPSTQSFVIYDQSISGSQVQFQSIILINGALQLTRVFGADNYNKLSATCVNNADRLLQNPDACRAICLSTRLFWHLPATNRGEDNVGCV